ncbi:N-acetylmuramoyl-L-alanine amidase [Streptomyces sp. NPDC088763]|uniref:N-acetylmuramoyl-L-alanine amidase n=1 Tax=Streptomyces sp. NPDC088763 TaxID=3365892 RepID=UPI00382D9018
MERVRTHLSRRRVLQGTALAAVPYVLLPEQRAGAHVPGPDQPSAEWRPAGSACYSVAQPGTARTIDRVIIHMTQTMYRKTLFLFEAGRKKVSSHYVVRSADGHTSQCVRESDIAWHAGNWQYNERSIGIEHEGWVDEPSYFTDVMYESSARLTAAICARHGIPTDRTHIIGHHEVPGSDHTDPGPHWDWARYIRLVKAA